MYRLVGHRAPGPLYSAYRRNESNKLCRPYVYHQPTLVLAGVRSPDRSSEHYRQDLVVVERGSDAQQTDGHAYGSLFQCCQHRPR